MMEVVSGDNWRYKTCKALVKSMPSINQHPVFNRPDALPIAQPTVSKLYCILSLHFNGHLPGEPGLASVY